MSESKHTPGPWTIDTGSFETGIAIHPAGSNLVVTECWPMDSEFIAGGRGSITDDPRAMANARLIAAAPELLEALMHIVNDCPVAGEDAVLTAAGYNKACAAIAKAVAND